MRVTIGPAHAPALRRTPAVAGSFYPADPRELARMVCASLEAADPPAPAIDAAAHGLAGILVPHAGLVYSGRVAATAWRLASEVGARSPDDGPGTVVLLGTNHGASWLDGVGVWDRGAWDTPLGPVDIDDELADAVIALGAPFGIDRAAHGSEHSLEVQLPFVATALAGARIVPLAVSTGTGADAIDAGRRLGGLLAERRLDGARITLAISTDMAHYPPVAIAVHVTDALAPVILALDGRALARREAELVLSGLPGVACGMCGIEPSVLGCAALRAMGVERGMALAAATSADVGGPPERTVGYFAAAFPG